MGGPKVYWLAPWGSTSMYFVTCLQLFYYSLQKLEAVVCRVLGIRLCTISSIFKHLLWLYSFFCCSWLELQVYLVLPPYITSDTVYWAWIVAIASICEHKPIFEVTGKAARILDLMRSHMEGRGHISVENVKWLQEKRVLEFVLSMKNR